MEKIIINVYSPKQLLGEVISTPGTFYIIPFPGILMVCENCEDAFIDLNVPVHLKSEIPEELLLVAICISVDNDLGITAHFQNSFQYYYTEIYPTDYIEVLSDPELHLQLHGVEIRRDDFKHLSEDYFLIDSSREPEEVILPENRDDFDENNLSNFNLEELRLMLDRVTDDSVANFELACIIKTELEKRKKSGENPSIAS